ncbi:MAG: hypothetical protein OXC17_15210 [Aestuariivita sp.]|nr:hypothetical protein [Aestuariivita sp.]
MITEIVSELAELDDQISVLLDITCFRREELLILVRSVVNYFNRTRLEKTYFVYSVASSMGTWLSNSVREVRPVIGYPGDVSITKKTHLILLAGVEYHRALAVIQAYEPYSISLGTVPEDQAVNSEIFKRNEELRVWLKRNFEQVLQTFHFPATDPMALKCQLRKFISEFSDYNVVIAPLNTKLSTLAAGALAVSKPEIQLCYAEVNVYNAGDYSTPSNDIVLVPAKKLLTDD